MVFLLSLMIVAITQTEFYLIKHCFNVIGKYQFKAKVKVTEWNLNSIGT